VKIQTLVQPAREIRTKVEARTGILQRQVEVTPERYEWVPVVCVDTPEGRNSIQAVQSALAARKYYSGPIDGLIGPKTKQALAAFQRANGLPGRGSLTVATARALGL
jgi:peptidoglycan hydrolase-like protein with peptidoglycan-binding domain